MTIWTDDMTAELRRLWKAGRSGAEIAEALGNGVTRAGAIGKANRLRLLKRHPRKTGDQFVKSVEAKLKPRIPKATPPKPAGRRLELVASVASAPLNIALLDLKPRMCRWPTGDGKPQTFCGHDKISGNSYCAFHAARAITVMPRKVRPHQAHRHGNKKTLAWLGEKAA